MRFPLAFIVWMLPTFAIAAPVAAYLPAETDAVVTIQVRQVADSELGKKVGADLFKSLLGASKQASVVVEASGLDLLKDFDVITVGINLDRTNPPKPFALFEGKFDAKKLRNSMAAFSKEHPERLTAVTIDSKSGYKLPGRKDAEDMFVAVLDETKLALAGSEKDLAGAMHAAAGERKPVISRELAGLLATAKSTAPIFARAWVKGKLGDLKLPNERLNAQVQKVDWATVAITVNKDVALTLTVNAPDEPSAKVLSDLFGAVVGLIRLQIAAAAEDQPELMPIRDLLRSARVAPVGKTVVATGSVKGEAIEKALQPPEPKKAEAGKK